MNSADLSSSLKTAIDSISLRATNETYAIIRIPTREGEVITIEMPIAINHQDLVLIISSFAKVDFLTLNRIANEMEQSVSTLNIIAST